MCQLSKRNDGGLYRNNEIAPAERFKYNEGEENPAPCIELSHTNFNLTSRPCRSATGFVALVSNPIRVKRAHGICETRNYWSASGQEQTKVWASASGFASNTSFNAMPGF